VSEADWPEATYPPWAHGAGYVLTSDIVREIAAGAAAKMASTARLLLLGAAVLEPRLLATFVDKRRAGRE
jgi:hypothetical protein